MWSTVVAAGASPVAAASVATDAPVGVSHTDVFGADALDAVVTRSGTLLLRRPAPPRGADAAAASAVGVGWASVADSVHFAVAASRSVRSCCTRACSSSLSRRSCSSAPRPAASAVGPRRSAAA